MQDWIALLISTLAGTLRTATPLMFCAMGGLFAERSGVIDVGLEGKMLAGAFAAASIAAWTGSPWLGLVGAVLVAQGLALLHGYACITHRGNQVVSGVAINILVSGPDGGVRHFLVPCRWADAAAGAQRTLPAPHLARRRRNRNCSTHWPDLYPADQRPESSGLCRAGGRGDHRLGGEQDPLRPASAGSGRSARRHRCGRISVAWLRYRALLWAAYLPAWRAPICRWRRTPTSPAT